MRYWANVAHDTTYVEVDADVNEECVSIIAMVKSHQITMERVCSFRDVFYLGYMYLKIVLLLFIYVIF